MKYKFTRVLLIISLLIVLAFMECKSAYNESEMRIITGNNNDFQIIINSDGSIKLMGEPDDAYNYNFTNWKDIKDISIGVFNVVAVKKDGTILITGNNDLSVLKALEWRGIKKLTSSVGDLFGLKEDGTILYAGTDPEGEMAIAVSQWQDVVDIEASWTAIIGIKRNGDVLAVGLDEEKNEIVKGWHNIKSINIAMDRVIAITSSGEILSTDNQGYSTLYKEIKGAIKVCISNNYLTALMPDGTIRIRYFSPSWPTSDVYSIELEDEYYKYMQSQIPDTLKELNNEKDVQDIDINLDKLAVLKQDGIVLTASFSID